ncbi:hypothetical protein FFLO_02837 [Filobasidium floriforme]|uniref:Peptide-methionine (R)-S-oxide reductase n=1 Tax=Filobasidium floriforme TaxID=5210 RepID=A0A8K0NRG3_9TREE|nr:Mss4-like protein [Filobasidium floriforme]KAG7558274.1 hypothetical protein FFLO_02837 [Filobasidium floriforme]KAH8080500.1 Mss4-like protein [Filobasidium floriforme]
MPSLSRSTILTSLIVLIFSIYMLPTILRTASNRLAPLARKSILTPSRVGVATTTPLAAFSLFNLGNTASFGSMGRNDIGNDEAPLEPKVVKQDSEWRAQLSPEQFRVLRQKGTEAPGSGKYNKHKEDGVYTCGACDAPLYKSKTKFDSGCGWPAFYEAIPGAVGRNVDRSMFMERIEIVCNNCGGHLGHVFKGEKFGNPIDERHCVNSISMDFKADDQAKA